MRITSFQSFRFVCIYMLAIPLAFMIPPLIASADYEGWVPIVIGGVVNMGLIYCTYRIGIRSSNRPWIEAGERMAGKWGHRIFLGILVLWSIYYVSLDIEQFTLFYEFLYMRDTPQWFIQLLIGVAICLTARWGFTTLVYIADGLFIIILVSIIFLIVMLSGDAEFQMMSALFTHIDIRRVPYNVVNILCWIGEWFVFLFMTPQFSFDKRMLRNLLLANALVILAVLFTWMLVILNFGPHYGSQLKYPILQLIRSTSFTGLVGNADPIFIGLWITSMLVHDAFLVYVGVSCMGRLFKIEEHKPLITLLMGTVTVTAFQYTRNPTIYQKVESEPGFIVFWMIINGIPVYYLLLSTIRSRLGSRKG